ncbi:TrmH family RNA methyltransferase [Streptococcus sciuri]|uniref:RNA methyltransferase n=1 Tax=Streptococcus sciuri TaxID=2973939 RepID=A0ABT2F8P7_9STRE|nr:RNA methyltransferase [Streptococcus sciuri]MCS4488843.1 RNA methyltransferase [Streptococcus sciuri]
MTIITSKTNNLIKKTKKLLQKKYRKTSYLIEGWHLLEEARANKAGILRVFVTEDFLERVKEERHISVVSYDVLKELTESQTPQGVVAEIALDKQDWSIGAKKRFLILEDVQDPGNVGTMIRTADAAGFDAVIVSDKSADIYSQKTLRSMQGSHFHLPIYRLAMSDILDDLKANHIPLLVSTLSKDSIDYRQLKPLSSFALVMGNEGKGISDEMAKRADYLVHIDMLGQAESLNVAVAAGILIFSLI